MTDGYDVVVVGSLNQDLVARVPHIPAPGETVLASGHGEFAGGKGANQATAAARLGARVAMIGRVGDDAFGRSLVAGLEADGVDVGRVSTDATAGTGLALINVAANGENSISVSPGANHNVQPSDVEAAADVISRAKVVLLQLEIPLDAVAAAARIARGTVVLNPAPAAQLPGDLLERVDVLVPNESELAILTGGETGDIESVVAAARSLSVPNIVVTLGKSGALVVGEASTKEVPAPVVDAVDTTGAGDAFCGALAGELARGAYLQAAVRFAVKVASIAVTRAGAQASMPRRDEVT